MNQHFSFSIYDLKEKPCFLDTCAKWSFDEWGRHVPNCTLDKVRDNYLQSLKNDGLPMMWVAVSKGMLVGMVSLKGNAHAERSDLTPWLGSLYVQGDYRRKGLGKKLICHVEKQAMDMGYQNLYLYSSHASDFYKNLDWQKIGDVEDPMNSKRRAGLMKKVLSD